MSTPTVIEQVRRLVANQAMSRTALARAAGLHPNSLRDCTDPGWNPTSQTLAKLDEYLREHDETPVLVGPEEIIEEARNGRMYILVDDEDRENEGDLIIPAQMATPAAVNFMAMHGRGLICLALTRTRVEQLGLDPMSRNNRARNETAFTVSIEAREGISTGISAADRARTISVAIDGSKAAGDIVTPGHVFPLIAREGGVLVRAGHTEAAVDISRLAGLNPSGVICEIMNEDGTMARLPELIRFARRHGMKIGTIRDLITYRLAHDHLVERRSEATFHSRWGGEWKAVVFYNRASDEENLVLVKGHITPDQPTLVRMHSFSIFDDVYGRSGERSGLLGAAMEAIGEAGTGAIVLLNRPARDYASRAVRALGRETDAAPREDMEQRDYGVGAQLLVALGVRDMILLSNTSHSLVALQGYGLAIAGQQELAI